MAAVLSTIIPVFANREAGRLPRDRRRDHRAGLPELRHLGAPHVHRGHSAPGAGLLLGRARRSSRCRRRVQVFAWLATLSHGRPRWDVPMLYVFGFFFVFAMGGLTGVMLAMVPFDWQAHDTYFVVAHMHYVVAGALAFPMVAGALLLAAAADRARRRAAPGRCRRSG